MKDKPTTAQLPGVYYNLIILSKESILAYLFKKKLLFLLSSLWITFKIVRNSIRGMKSCQLFHLLVGLSGNILFSLKKIFLEAFLNCFLARANWHCLATSSTVIPTVEITAPAAEEPMSTKTEEIVVPSSFLDEVNEDKLKNGTNGEKKVIVVSTDEVT